MVTEELPEVPEVVTEELPEVPEVVTELSDSNDFEDKEIYDEDMEIDRNYQNYRSGTNNKLCRKICQDRSLCRRFENEDGDDVYYPIVNMKTFCREACYKDSLYCKEHGFKKSGDIKTNMEKTVVNINILHGCTLLSSEKFPPIVHKLDCKFNVKIRQFTYPWFSFVVKKTSEGNVVIAKLFRGFWPKELTYTDIEICHNNGLLYKRVPNEILRQQFTMGDGKDYILNLPGEGFTSYEQIRKKRPSLYIKYWKIWNEELLSRKSYVDKYGDDKELFVSIEENMSIRSLKKIQKHAKEFGCYPNYQIPETFKSYKRNKTCDPPEVKEILAKDFDAFEWCQKKGVQCPPMFIDYPDFKPRYVPDEKFPFWLDPLFRKPYYYGKTYDVFLNDYSTKGLSLFLADVFYPPKNYVLDQRYGGDHYKEKLEEYIKDCDYFKKNDPQRYKYCQVKYFCFDE